MIFEFNLLKIDIKVEKSMKIIESKTEGKAPWRLSEDSLVVTSDFIAVIDGVTPKSNFTYEGKSTGTMP